MPPRWVYLGFAALGGLNALATEGAAPITNDDIVKLVKADVSCTVIVTKIQSSDTAFDTSADALIELISAGVDEAVVLEMVTATSTSGRKVFTDCPTEEDEKPADD